MQEKKLRELIDRYYSGDSTLEEEELLRNYFSGADLLPGYEAEKEIFTYYSESFLVPPPSEDLEMRIMKSLDLSNVKNKHIFRQRKTLVLIGIAASFFLVISSYFFFLKNSEPVDTYTDPLIAYAEARRILYDVSMKLNKGTGMLDEISRIDRAAQTTLNTVEKSSDMISSGLGKVEIIGNMLKSDEKK